MAEACARYLRRLGGLSRLVDEPYGLHTQLDVSLGQFAAAARVFLVSLAQQLEAIDLHHRLHFGIVERALDTGESSSGRQDAYAVADPFAMPDEVPASFVLFTLPFARDIFLAWDALLSRRELFTEIGDPAAEQSVTVLISSRPSDPVRAAYARDQALLTLEFALLHEFYHVASGHLDAIKDGGVGARLHAVTASTEQSHVESSRYKVLELDADVMALRHLTMGVLGGRPLVPHEILAGASDGERFRHVGRAVTLLFRLIELWRRNVSLVYTAKDFHPHPDVRDATLHAYLRQNADPDGIRSAELAEAYGHGQSDIIEALEAMNTLAPNFGVVEGLGQDLAVRETEWLVPELNRVRKEGIGPRDFRRLAAKRRRGTAAEASGD